MKKEIHEKNWKKIGTKIQNHNGIVGLILASFPF